jgi:hypothetical protein
MKELFPTLCVYKYVVILPIELGMGGVLLGLGLELCVFVRRSVSIPTRESGCSVSPTTPWVGFGLGVGFSSGT